MGSRLLFFFSYPFRPPGGSRRTMGGTVKSKNNLQEGLGLRKRKLYEIGRSFMAPGGVKIKKDEG